MSFSWYVTMFSLPHRLHRRLVPSSAGCRTFPSSSVRTSTGGSWWSRTPSTAPGTGPPRRTPPRRTTLSSAGWPPSTPPPTWWWPTPTAASATTRTSRRTTTSSTEEPGTPSLAVSQLRLKYGNHLRRVSSERLCRAGGEDVLIIKLHSVQQTVISVVTDNCLLLLAG